MLDIQRDVCPLCNRPSQNTAEYIPPVWIRCATCGNYGLTESALLGLFNRSTFESLYQLSAFTREKTIFRSLRNSPNTPRTLLNDTSLGIPVQNSIPMSDVFDIFPKTVAERLDKTILNLGRLSPFPGSAVMLPWNDYPVAYSENEESYRFCLDQLQEAKLLTFSRALLDRSDVNTVAVPFDAPAASIVLTAEGWNRFADLEQGYKSSKPRQIFVAMAFAPDLQTVFDDGLKLGIEAAGYDVMRIDRAEHNDKIDDRIIAEIRKSRFLVADFTLQRGGVYFEAGFALGLGMPVIWTCREDDIKNLHFDTRQYNHIVWESPEELAQRLQQRIEATIGRFVS